MPRRRARQRPRQARPKPPQIQRMHPVDVLVRVDGQQRRVVVQVARHRILDQQRVHRRIVVEIGDRPMQVGLAWRPPAGARAARRTPAQRPASA